MTKVEKHLRFHLELFRNDANRHGVTIQTGSHTCTLTCIYPDDYTRTVHIWFDSMTATDLINRFGIRKISHLDLVTPEHMQIVFEQQWGMLFVNADKGRKQMECRWKNGRLWRYEANQPVEKVKYNPGDAFTLISHADEHIAAALDGE